MLLLIAGIVLFFPALAHRDLAVVLIVLGVVLIIVDMLYSLSVAAKDITGYTPEDSTAPPESTC